MAKRETGAVKGTADAAPVVTPAPAAVVKVAATINYKTLVNGSCGTQMKEAFHIAGIDLNAFCPPGASNSGVYNGVHVVDAFKAWDKANPGKINMNTISVGMRGTQVVDAFKLMTA